MGEDARAKRLAVARQEERHYTGVAAEVRAGLSKVALYPAKSAGTERHYPVLAALAMAHREGAPLRPYVGQLQTRELGPADAGRVKDLQHGTVAHPQGVGDVRDSQEPGELFLGHRLDRQTPLPAGHFQFGSGVVQDHVFTGEPPKEGAKDVEPVAKRAPAKPLALVAAARGLAEGQPALVGLQDRPGDLPCPGSRPFRPPRP